MNLIWWFIWMGLIFWIFATPYSIPGQRFRKDTAFDILRKRYAREGIDDREVSGEEVAGDGFRKGVNLCLLIISGITGNAISAETLNAMKKWVILVNIARGTLVDEAALFDAVKSGHIAAAGLDVMQKEPVDQGNILLSLPQVLITPHVAGATDNPKMTHNNNWCCESEARDQGHSAPTKV